MLTAQENSTSSLHEQETHTLVVWEECESIISYIEVFSKKIHTYLYAKHNVQYQINFWKPRR